MFYAATLPTPLGSVLAIVDEEGRLVKLLRQPANFALDTNITWDKGKLAPVSMQLAEYFRGERTAFDIALAPQGTPFQHQVWKEIARIPYGETRTYAQLAQQIGSPNACRAVGGANGKNPIWIVVPCHRVLGAGGALTGYAGGLAAKQHLLALEGAGSGLFGIAK